MTSDPGTRKGPEPGAVATTVSARGFGWPTRLRKKVADVLVARRNRQAERRLRTMPKLWQRMRDYAGGSAVTGASYSDYLTLYEEVRRLKPREILECGTGITTVVMAHALAENEAEAGARGRITSMEDDPNWFAAARDRMPDDLAAMIDLVHSPKRDGFYKCFRGVCYEAVPERAYDFVFSDGPDRHSPVNGDKLFNLDLIHVIERADRPLNAVVDNHYLTFYILQKVLGPAKARYSVPHKLMFVGPVSRRDLRFLKKENFVPDLRPFGRTELHLRMAAEDDEVNG